MFVLVQRRDQGKIDPGGWVKRIAAAVNAGGDAAEVVYPHPSILCVGTCCIRQGDLTLLWDGRLDGLHGAKPKQSEFDAKWLLAGYRKHGSRIFEKLRGPYVCAFIDSKKRSVTVARDPIGQRYLSYALTTRHFVAGCSDGLVVEYPQVSREANPGSFVAKTVCGHPKGPETVFRDVRELLPGTTLRVDGPMAQRSRFWRIEDIPRVRYRDSREYAEHYRELIDDSVDKLIDRRTRTGVSLSGGLDSSPIAMFAARHCAERGAPKPIAVSWRLLRTKWADEGHYIESVCRAAALERVDVPADDLWAFSDIDAWRINECFPAQDNYRLKLDAGYRAAAESGCRVLLTGTFGDSLYVAGAWPRAMLLDGEIRALYRDITHFARDRGPGPTARLLARSVLPGFDATRRRRTMVAHLSTAARAFFSGVNGYPPASPRLSRRHQLELVLELGVGNSVARERLFSSHYGIELRYPFLDLPLIEFMLGVPTSEVWRYASASRPILRRAMQGIVPHKVLERRDKANFIQLHRRLYREGRRRMDEILAIRPSVSRRLLGVPIPNPDRPMTGHEEWLLWQVLSLEHWLEHSRFGPSLRDDLVRMLDDPDPTYTECCAI